MRHADVIAIADADAGLMPPSFIATAAPATGHTRFIAATDAAMPVDDPPSLNWQAECRWYGGQAGCGGRRNCRIGA